MVERGLAVIEPTTTDITPAARPKRLWVKVTVAAVAAALLAALTLVLWPGRPDRPAAPTVKISETAPLTPAMRPLPARDWGKIESRVAELLTTARLQQSMALQERVSAFSSTLRGRVERTFLPWYLSFGRRKLEELGAYNLYARDRLTEWMGGGRQESAQVKLITTFEAEFAKQVLRPDETRHTLRRIAQDVADGYANRVAIGLREIQNDDAISFADWQTFLARHPPLVFTDAHGRRRQVPLAALASPDPSWVEIGDAIGDAAIQRFDRLPSIIDLTALVDSDGRSIFSAGENAAIYFGSYLLYWAVLIILLRTGVIPFSIFSFLLGWILWEIFAWGSWIGIEYFDFEQTRARLAPVIETRTDAYLGHFTASIADSGPMGPLQVLYHLERKPQP